MTQAKSLAETVFSLLQTQNFIPYFELSFILRRNTISKSKKYPIMKRHLPGSHPPPSSSNIPGKYLLHIHRASNEEILRNALLLCKSYIDDLQANNYAEIGAGYMYDNDLGNAHQKMTEALASVANKESGLAFDNNLSPVYGNENGDETAEDELWRQTINIMYDDCYESFQFVIEKLRSQFHISLAIL